MNYIINKLLENLEAGIDKQDVRYYYFGMPENLGNEQLIYGALMIIPVSQSTNAVTTGITDMDVNSLDIVLAKSMKGSVYRNAQKETGHEFLTRIMCGQDGTTGILLTNTVRYIVRKYMKDWGVRQPEVSIDFDDNKIEIEGVVTATMRVVQEGHTSQVLN